MATDVAQLDIVIRAINATGPGIAAAQGQVRALEATTNRVTGNAARSAARWRSMMERTSLGLTNVGRVTQTISLGLLAAGGAASVMAYKFDKSVTKMRTMAGVSAKEMEKFRGQLLKLAPALAKSPEELAEGLYFVVSSGFKGAQAMDILEKSAMAASAGLGEVMTVADAVTSVMSAYGPATIGASRSIDILIKAVEEGKAEPEEFAASLGRIIPIAASMQIPFEQVAGALASMTVTGLSTYESVTALRGALQALSAPTNITVEALAKIGLTYEDMARSFRENGILPTLKMIYDRTKGDRLLQRQLIPNVRALTGAEGLLGARYEKNLGLIQRVTGANGQLARSFAAVKESPAWQFDQKMAELKVAAVEMGQEILPEFTKLVKWVTSLVQGWNNLDAATRANIISLAKWGIAIGLVIKPVATLLRGLTMATTMFAGMRTASAAASLATGAASGVGVATQVAATSAAAAPAVIRGASYLPTSTGLLVPAALAESAVVGGGSAAGAVGGGAAAAAGIGTGIAVSAALLPIGAALAGAIVQGVQRHFNEKELARLRDIIGESYVPPPKEEKVDRRLLAKPTGETPQEVYESGWGQYEAPSNKYGRAGGGASDRQGQKDAETERVLTRARVVAPKVEELRLKLNAADTYKEITNVSKRLAKLRQFAEMDIDLTDLKDKTPLELDSLVQKVHRATGITVKNVRTMFEEIAGEKLVWNINPPNLTKARRAFRNFVKVARTAGDDTVDGWATALMELEPAGGAAGAAAAAAVMRKLNTLPERTATIAAQMAEALLSGTSGAIDSTTLQLEKLYIKSLNVSAAGKPVTPQTGGTFTGPKTGYPAVLHGTETVVAHDSPEKGLAALAKQGFLGFGGGGDTIVNVYLDGRLIERQVTKRQSERQARLDRGFTS